MSDWLEEVGADATAMAAVHKAVDKWRELRFKRDEAESRFKAAEKVYNDFCNDVVAKLFRQNGLEALKLEDGSTVEVVEKIRCSIQKDSKKQVADWLRQHQADNLVKSQLIVMPSAAPKLKELGIGYDEEVDMNTNSVKAWVKGEMNVQNISVDDLPKGLSWYEYDEIQVKE